MKLKLFVSTLIAGALLAAAPVWADGGHRHGHGHGKHWEKHHRHYDRHHSHLRHTYRGDRVVVREYVERVPVYRDYYPAPAAAPGISIVTPDIFIPWPR